MKSLALLVILMLLCGVVYGAPCDRACGYAEKDARFATDCGICKQAEAVERIANALEKKCGGVGV